MGLWTIDSEKDKLYAYGFGKKYQIDYEDADEIVIILERYKKWEKIETFFTPKNCKIIEKHANYLTEQKYHQNLILKL